MTEAYYQEVIEALTIFYEKPHVDEKTRKQTDFFLQKFLQSPISWEISDRILREKNLPLTFYFYAANTLTIRLRGHFDDLPNPRARLAFRDSLISNLSLFFSQSHEISSVLANGANLRVVERLATALSILIVHLISIGEWSTGLQDITNILIPNDVQQNIQRYIYDPTTLSRFLILLRVFSSLPEILNDSRFHFSESLAAQCDQEAPRNAMLAYKPILLIILSNLLYLAKPVLWNFSKLKQLMNSHREYNNALQLTDAHFQQFQTNYAFLFQNLTSTSATIYKDLGDQCLQCLTTWANYRILTLRDLIVFTLTPSNDPQHQNPLFTLSPLPNDPSVSLITQPVPSPTIETYPYSLYTLLITSTLHTPDFTTNTAELLSLLYSHCPAMRDFDLITGEQLCQTPEENLFLRSANYENCDKPAWLLLFIQNTLINFQTIYQRAYAAEEGTLGIKLINMFADFASLFQIYLHNDPNITPNDPQFALPTINHMFGPVANGLNDIFSTIFHSLVNALNLTYQPYTSQSALESLQNLVQTYNPQQQPDKALFFLLYSFIPQIELESVQFPHQIITTRKNVFNSSFSIFANLVKSSLDSKEYLWSELDNISASLRTAQHYGGSDIYQLEIDQDSVQNRLDHLTDRIQLLSEPMLTLINIILTSAQYPTDVDELLPDISSGNDSRSSDDNATEYQLYRGECAYLVSLLIQFIDRSYIFKIWFSCFEKFQTVYRSFMDIYPYPTNIYTDGGSKNQAVWQNIKSYTSHHNLSLLSPFQLAQNCTNISSTSNLNHILPYIQVYNPKTTPAGWQPLEQYFWIFSILADHIQSQFESYTGLSRQIYSFYDHGRQLKEEYQTRKYSEAQFHLTMYGEQYHPQTPYGHEQFSDSDLAHEKDILLFLEQLSTIFELFISHLHRNMHSLTLDTFFCLLRDYCSFLSLPICIHNATGSVIDLTTNQPLNQQRRDAGQLMFTSNVQIVRVLTHILLSFGLYPTGFHSFNMDNQRLAEIQQLHSHIIVPLHIAATAQPSQSFNYFCTTLLNIPSYTQQHNTTTTNKQILTPQMLLSEGAFTALVEVFSSNATAIVASEGEAFFNFFLFIMRRTFQCSFQLLPQHFFHLIRKHTNNNPAIPPPTISITDLAPNTLCYNIWATSPLTKLVLTIFNILPTEAQHNQVFTTFTNEIFELLKQNYGTYTTWVKEGIVGLETIFHQTNGNVTSSSLYDHCLAQFNFITRFLEASFINHLYSIQILFERTHRPYYLRQRSAATGEYSHIQHNDLATTSSFQAFATGGRVDQDFLDNFFSQLDKPRNQLIAQALSQTLPMFEEIIKTFSFKTYTLPTSASTTSTVVSADHNTNLLREHIIVDKLISIWNGGIRKCFLEATDIIAQVCTISCKYFSLTQHSSFLYSADIMVRLSTTVEEHYIKQALNQPHPPAISHTTRLGQSTISQFNSAAISQQFLDYSVQVVFSLASEVIKQKHPQHISFDLFNHGYFGVETFPDLHNPQSQVRTAQVANMEATITNCTQFFPENHLNNHAAGRVQTDPQDIYKINSVVIQPPTQIPILDFFSNKNIYSIHIVTQCFIEFYPEVTEDFLGLLIAILWQHPCILKQSKRFLPIIGFVIAALYCSHYPTFSLALRFINELFPEFIYTAPGLLHINSRTRYPSGPCQSIHDVQTRLQQLTAVSGGELSENQCSYNSYLIRKDPHFNTPVSTSALHPTCIRYLNLLDCYTLNQFDREAYLLLSLIAPTIFTHLMLACLSFNRPTRDLAERSDSSAVNSEIMQTMNVLMTFIHQNIEPLNSFSYIAYTQQLQNFTKFFTMFQDEQTELLVQQSIQQPSQDLDPVSLMAPQPPLTIQAFSAAVQTQFNFFANPSLVSPGMFTSTVINVLVNALTFGISPYYFTKPQQISNYLDALATTPPSQHSSIQLAPPDQLQQIQPPDPVVIAAVVKTYASLLTTPSERAVLTISRDLISAFYTIRNERRRSNDD